MKSKFKNTILSIAAIFAILSLAGCDSNIVNSIPATGSDKTIQAAAKELNISEETLQRYLDSVGVSYNELIDNLNSSSKTITDMKTEIETNYACSFADYAQTIISTSNQTIPDAKTFTVFKSQYAKYNTYFPTNILNTEKTGFKDYAVKIEVADSSQNAYAFDVITKCNNDLSSYVNVLNQLYGCSSVEFTNITIFGRHGTFKPTENTGLLDGLFAYDEKTNEIVEKFVIPVMTLKFDKTPEKNMSFALSNELGLVFSTTGSDSLTTMLKLTNVDFQIRNVNFDKIEVIPETIGSTDDTIVTSSSSKTAVTTSTSDNK